MKKIEILRIEGHSGRQISPFDSRMSRTKTRISALVMQGCPLYFIMKRVGQQQQRFLACTATVHTTSEEEGI